ncbi:MAG TPA: hypothetical protein VMT95_14180 [Candidatus Binatia bacterium]|nr:hypothetical protein [Candidatus Binatia bacterium]
MRRALAVLTLCCLGATASPSPSPKPTATPNPYRQIEFASMTLGGRPSGGIDITRGWAAVKRDGKAAVVCVSFKNVAAVTATHVLFDFSLAGRSGAQLGRLELDRRGTFSPGVDIEGWHNLSDWQSGMGHRGYNDNCTVFERGVAAAPLLSAHYVTYEDRPRRLFRRHHLA